MKNKEKIYDEQISPLMKEILEICKRENIPMFSEFQFSDDGFCTSAIPNKEHAVFNIYRAISKCKGVGNINLDQFLFWCIKEFDCSASLFLNKYNKKEAPKELEEAVEQPATNKAVSLL